MKKRLFLKALSAVVVLFALGGSAWVFSLPRAPVRQRPGPIPAAETQATLRALASSKRARPLIAVIGANDGTETTDYIMPLGILRRADVADVVAIATGKGPVSLYPAFTVEPDSTVADFDARHPEGADFVIVPAMKRADDAVVLRWLKEQSAKNARIIGVCAGAPIVANAELLDGKRATTHWYFLGDMLEEHPAIRYVPDRRFLVDQRVATTTGISASMPMALTLIEAIAGRGRAESVARELGVEHWDARHHSASFRLTRPFALTVLGNRLSFWRHETLGIALRPGMDEVSLALVADAWSRTYRSRAVTFSASREPLRTRTGLRVIPDAASSSWPEDRRITNLVDHPPAQALDRTLDAIATRYGRATADVVATQLEYAR